MTLVFLTRQYILKTEITDCKPHVTIGFSPGGFQWELFVLQLSFRDCET